MKAITEVQFQRVGQMPDDLLDIALLHREEIVTGDE
jgi:hypothetical protein